MKYYQRGCTNEGAGAPCRIHQRLRTQAKDKRSQEKKNVELKNKRLSLYVARSKLSMPLFSAQSMHSMISPVVQWLRGLPWWLSGKESTCNARAIGDTGSIPGWGRCPGGGHRNPLQYSCLENPTEKGPWQTTVDTVAKSCTRRK